jgi:hypothetical protein
MSDDQKPPDESGAAEDSPEKKAPAEQGRQADTSENPEEQESEELSLLDSIAHAEKDWQKRSDSLRGLFGAQSGRDLIGEASYRVSGGGDLNQFNGGVTFNVSDAAGVEVSYLPSETLDAKSDYFVPPDSQQKLSQALEREALVFLRGPEGTGRATAALAALTGWVRSAGHGPANGGEERIGTIRTRGTVGRGSFPELLHGRGYLLDGTHDDWIRDIDHLRDLVVKSESRIVVLVSRGRANLPGTPVDHCPPPAIEVFRRRLEHEARLAGIQPHLAAEIDKEIAEDLDGENSPQRAVAQAYEVVQALKEGRSSEALLEELPRRLGDHIRGRLDQGQPIVGRCFMAAVAVLHDLPEFTVSQAALRLADLIYEAWHIEDENRPPPTWEQLDAWLEYAGATAHRPTRAGGGRAVRLNRRYAPAVTIRVLWEDHPTVREPLMSWLLGLGEDSNSEVQLKAAHAVGKLATLDFDTIRRRFLTPWTSSRRFADHRLAALALEAAAQDPDMALRVHDHLRQLVSSDRYGARAVAIQAYGSSIGANAIGEALQALRRISTPLMVRVNRNAARSIAYLCEEGTAPMVVRELASWVETGSPGGRHTAALAFMPLAVPDGGTGSRSVLAQLGTHNDLVLLWLNALTLRIIPVDAERSRPAVPAAWGVLGEWVSRYDQQPASRAVIDEVFRRADARAALLHLRLWRRRELISTELYTYVYRLVREG